MKYTNPQKKYYLGSIFFTIFFFFIAVYFYNNYQKYNSFAGAVIFISIFLSISFFVLIFMFKKRYNIIENAINLNDFIVKWQYSKKDWNNFLAIEYNLRIKENIGKLILVTIMILLIFIPFIIFINEGRLAMFIVMIGLIMILSFFAFFVPFMNYVLKKKENRLIIITTKGVLIGNTLHNWNFMISKFKNAKFKINPFNHIEINYEFIDRLGPRDYTLFIPIPNSKYDFNKVIVELNKLKKKR
jgi:hypothetical protein